LDEARGVERPNVTIKRHKSDIQGAIAVILLITAIRKSTLLWWLGEAEAEGYLTDEALSSIKHSDSAKRGAPLS
jgi:hypothetical protein